MRDLLKALVLASLLASCAAACDRGQSPPQVPPGSITGRERLGWDQQAPHADELREYSWALYVDGVPFVLTNATCGALGGEGPSAACVSPLPPLKPGQRTLELATRITAGGSMIESARSAPLSSVTGSGASGTASATASATASWSPGGRVPSAPGQRAQTLAGPHGAPYVIEMVVAGLDRPSALAKLPDGRLLIAERGGRIRVADAGVLLAAPAAELPPTRTQDGDEGVSLAVAPDFESTRHVFVSHVSRDTGGARVGRVVRFREAGGTLGERAVILDGLPAGERAPRIRFGPDGALYVGTTAVDTRDADDLGSYGGKILRFTAAGGTPSDNPTRLFPRVLLRASRPAGLRLGAGVARALEC